MISYLRFSLFPLVFFPLLYAALLAGGWWGWGYTFGLVTIYLLADNLLTGAPARVTAQNGLYHNTVLVLHIPLSVLALALLFWQSAPENAALSSVVQWLHHTLPWLPGPQPVDHLVQYIGLVAAVGFIFGHNTAVAHELMHRRRRFLFEASRLLFALCGDAQVVISHIHSHHTKVATNEDPTSARRGHSIYRHFIRALAGQYRDSLAFERVRLRPQPSPKKWLRHQVLMGLLMSGVPLAVVTIYVGWTAVLSWLVIMLMAKWLLESINYVQHYGLVRVPGQPIEPRHSWECQGIASTLGLYNATRHGGHHVNGNAPFWQLHFEGRAPTHPYGYMYAIALALIPALWLRYITPLLEHWDRHMATPGELALLNATRSPRADTLADDAKGEAELS